MHIKQAGLLLDLEAGDICGSPSPPDDSGNALIMGSELSLSAG